MPKQKTHRGAAKRLKRTGTGKVKRHHAYHSHILSKKSPKRKRRLRTAVILKPGDTKVVNHLIPR
jgi:large subunit ribosomal protein L35